MALISFSTPSLVSGVSQQPDPLRFSTQAEKQENAYSSIVDGLCKRQPTNHLAQMVSGSNFDSCKVHPINRDTSERYLVLYRQNEIKVWDIVNGVERNVQAPGGGSADFSYINQLDVSRLKSLTVADTTFVCNPDTEVAMSASVSAAASPGGLIFVKAGNYKTDYFVSWAFKNSGGSILAGSTLVTTWDGNTSGNSKNIHRIGPFPLSGNPTGTYSVDVLEDTASITGVSSGSITASDFASAIQAINGVTATTFTGSGGYYVRVTGSFNGLDTRVSNLTKPAASIATIAEEQGHTEATEDSIETSDIAARIATEMFATLSASPGGASAYINSVGAYNSSTVFIDAKYELVYLEVSDGQGDTSMFGACKKVARVTDLPVKCVDGFRIKIEGDPEQGEDDYYAEFEASGDLIASPAFGSGVWKECIGPNLPYEFDASTMPHKLVRKFSGATPYFEFGPVDWVDRAVGDDLTNAEPSFVGLTINDIFLFRGRMGFLSDDNVILSEAGNFENFWRTTTTILAESDRIDIGVSHPQVSILHSAVQWNEKLIVFSDQNQFLLEGDPYLTPQTAQVSTITSYENISSTRPVGNGRSVAFPYKQGDYSGVRELYQAAQDVYDADDTTQPVPTYLAGNIVEMASSTVDGVLVCLTEGERSSLYIFKYYYSGQDRAQAAWSKFTFGSDAQIRSVAFIDTTLYLVVVRDQGLYLESLEFGPNLQDPDSEFVVRLDRRVADNSTGVSASYSPGNDWTTITLPYNVAAGRTYKVVRRATAAGGEAGQSFTIAETPSGSNIKVSGDITSEPFWVGEQYIMDYQFSAPRIREAVNTPGGRGTVTTGRQQIKAGHIVYDTSRYFQLDVTPEGRSTSTVSFTKGLPDSGSFRFPIRSKNDQVTVRVHNNSHLPSNIISIEWEADYNTVNSRYRG